MILCTHHRANDGSICEREQRGLLAFHKFFNHHAAACRTEGTVLHDAANCIQCLSLTHCDNDALPCSKTICLDDNGYILFFYIRTC